MPDTRLLYQSPPILQLTDEHRLTGVFRDGSTVALRIECGAAAVADAVTIDLMRQLQAGELNLRIVRPKEAAHG